MPPITNEILSIAWAARCNVFIESGTFYGESFSKAINSGIFERCYSVEIQPELYQKLVPRFPESPSQKVFLGISYEVFAKEIFPRCSAQDRLFFWLDGHYSAGVTGGRDLPCPLLSELAAIEQHCPTKSLVIAIDDANDLGRQHDQIAGHNWPTRSEVEAAARRVNPSFICLDYSGANKIERGLLVFSYRTTAPALVSNSFENRVQRFIMRSVYRAKHSIRRYI
jgi:hypothetical protein